VTSPELRHSRIAILGYFFILGVGFTAWSARLPAIKQSLHLSDGRLGLALFAVPAGSVLTLALSGRIADRFGAERVLRVAGVLFPAALVPVGLAGNLAELMAVLALFGALAGLLDVSMNACGARLELGYGRPIMSSLHAGYSIAGLGGAAIGGVSAWLGASPLATFAVAAVVLIVLGLLAAPHVFIPAVAPLEERPGDPPRRSPRQIATVIWVLGLLALCGQVGEGSAGDWSAVYLHVDLGTSAGAAAVALGAFSVTMAAGRVAGDRLAARFGPVRLVRASGLVAGLGLAGGLLVGTPAAAVVGFALLGLGLAGIFPQIVTAAARLDPGQAGRNIGRIAAVSYSGLLSGPVVIGAIASGVGLRNALLVPAALAVLVAAAAGVMKPRLAWRPAQRSEQGVLRLHPAHGVVVQRDAADAPVGGQGARLRPDLLGGEHALHRGQQRVPVQ
jgi:MFS family permease